MSNSKQIIVWENKYGNMYYAARTVMEKAWVYGQIFNTMLNTGNYNNMKTAKQDIKIWEQELVELELTQTNSARNCSVIAGEESVENKIQRVIKQITYMEHDIKVFKAARDGNVKAMAQFIRDRSDHYEYEKVYTDNLICSMEEEEK